MKRSAVVALLISTLAILSIGYRLTVMPTLARELMRIETDNTNALEKSLIEREKQSWEAWKKRDGQFFQDFLSDDHVEVGFFGLTNKASVVKGVSSPACVVSSYTVDHFKLTAFDANTAVLTYHAAQDTKCGGNAVPSPVWVSSLYVKRSGRWLNALYQQTKDLRQPAN